MASRPAMSDQGREVFIMRNDHDVPFAYSSTRDAGFVWPTRKPERYVPAAAFDRLVEKLREIERVQVASFVCQVMAKEALREAGVEVTK
jgi:hypothetical protein